MLQNSCMIWSVILELQRYTSLTRGENLFTRCVYNHAIYVQCMTMLFMYDHVFIFLCYAFQVTDKFYDLTGIRHNITSAYHPRPMVKWRDLTTQEAFLKCTEFSNKVKEADVDWHRKLNSILFTYRVRKQASTCINPFFMMYGSPSS